MPNITRLIPLSTIDSLSVCDTLVVSRLLNYGIEGGHSVEAWAKRLAKAPSKIQIDDWSEFTQDIVDRCVTDVEIQTELYRFFKTYIDRPEFASALETETYVDYLTHVMHVNGFPFDLEGASRLRDKLQSRLSFLDQELTSAFPPRRVLKSVLVARETQHGTVHGTDFRRLTDAGFTTEEITAGQSYEIYETEEFNPGSLHQILDRLWEAGWKPTDKTKGHAEFTKARSKDPEKLKRFEQYGWRLTEDNLRSLPDTAPEATKYLVERLLIASRVSDLDEWIQSVRESDNVPRIHSSFNGIGAWTQRLSSQSPNLMNIPVPQGKDNPSELDKMSDEINSLCRAFFRPEPGCVLVGADADGIQMRIFAHYVKDERLIKAILEGNKDNGTDIHSLHARALGPVCKGRNPAKTFIYAFLLGAGVGKVAEILECGRAEAKDAVDSFLQFYPGLSNLKKTQIPADAKRGYFVGLDGRPVVCKSEHLMLAGYLQNGEAVIMKRAAKIWTKELNNAKIYYRLHTWPHDEWQTSCLPSEAEYVGSVQADSIRTAAEGLNLNLPFKGDYRVGQNWLETH